MLINYWDCKFNDYEEFWDGETETRVYGCSHPDNKDGYCNKDNQWCGDKDDCAIAELDGIGGHPV